jgi:hypothetical protein
LHRPRILPSRNLLSGMRQLSLDLLTRCAEMDHGWTIAGTGSLAACSRDPCLRFDVSRVASSLHSLTLTEGAGRNTLGSAWCRLLQWSCSTLPSLHSPLSSHLSSHTCTPPSLPSSRDHAREHGGQRTADTDTARTRTNPRPLATAARAHLPITLPPLSAVSLPPSPRPPAAHLSSSTSSTPPPCCADERALCPA